MVTRDGVEYNRVKSLRWRIEPENARFHFTNLFNGDKTLGKIARVIVIAGFENPCISC